MKGDIKTILLRPVGPYLRPPKLEAEDGVTDLTGNREWVDRYERPDSSPIHLFLLVGDIDVALGSRYRCTDGSPIFMTGVKGNVRGDVDVGDIGPARCASIATVLAVCLERRLQGFEEPTKEVGRIDAFFQSVLRNSGCKSRAVHISFPIERSSTESIIHNTDDAREDS